MNKFQHLLWASLFFIIGYTLIIDIHPIKGPTLFLTFIICLTYSLIPDLDLSNSWIKRQLNVIVLYAILILSVLFFVNKMFIIPIIFLLVIEVILLLLKHRTILHSPITGIFLALPLYFISPIYFAAGYLGFFSHWMMDNVKLK
jgi:hypothetical protein